MIPHAPLRGGRLGRLVRWVVVGVLLAGTVACGSDAPVADRGPVTIAVPGDAATITEAVGQARSGDLVLVSPGRYTESVTISTPGITLRGTDRNTVIIDGEGIRPQGVLVIADGVRVQNLTVTSHTFNGVLVTGLHDGATATAHGVDGYHTLDPEKFPPINTFAINSVTATNNGLYGLYAFDSQHGQITDSYASGSADSGIYVGQCRQCDILVAGNVAERNAIGFENANASDSVILTGNRFSGNRVGMTLISNYQEAFQPQRGNTVAGNLITDNAGNQTPAQADGAYGLGVGIAGGQDNTLRNNTITGNPYAGIVLQGTEDIPATGNSITDNTVTGNGVDMADISTSRSPSVGNCLSGNTTGTVVPSALADSTCPTGTPTGPGATTDDLPALQVPPGISFLKVPLPKPQPQLPGDLAAIPTPLPAATVMPPLTDITAPAATLFADLVLTP